MKNFITALFLGLFLLGCSVPTEEIALVQQEELVAICSPIPFNPYAGAMPPAPLAPNYPPAGPPNLPPNYWCSWYPDPMVYGPINTSQYVTECTFGPTPQGSVDVYTGNNLHGGRCARITPPTHDGTFVFRPYFAFLGNGWHTKVNGTETFIRSVEVGPHTKFRLSSNARVDQTNWQCHVTASNSACINADNSSNSSLELDHIAATHTNILPGWTPWSLEISALY